MRKKLSQGKNYNHLKLTKHLHSWFFSLLSLFCCLFYKFINENLKWLLVWTLALLHFCLSRGLFTNFYIWSRNLKNEIFYGNASCENKFLFVGILKKVDKTLELTTDWPVCNNYPSWIVIVTLMLIVWQLLLLRSIFSSLLNY
jgi:hypothetical protein